MNIEEELSLSNLKEDFLYKIVANLNIDEISNLMKVNKRLNNFIKQSEFWNIYNLYNKNGLQVRNNNLSSIEMLDYLTSIQYLSKHYERSIELKGVYSTSQDNSQSIFETLSDNKNVFWSSSGTNSTDERDEVLIYSVKAGLGYINSFSLKYYFANYLQIKLYPCQRVLFEAGMSSDNLSYSEEFDCKMEIAQNEVEYVKRCTLKKAVLAKVIKLTLKGRVGLQETDSKYYIAIERIQMFGVPIHTIQSLQQNKQDDSIQYFLIQKIKSQFHSGNSSNKNKKEEQKFVEQNQPIIDQQYNQIAKLTSRIFELVIKNTPQNEDSPLNEELIQRKQASLFAESLDVRLFNKYPELRINLFAYEQLMKHPELMNQYMQQCLQQTTQLSELESITVIIQKIDFKILAKFMMCFLELFEQSSIKKSSLNKADDEERNKMAKILATFISSSFKLRNAPYEQELATFEFLTHSFEHCHFIIEQITEYLQFPNQDLTRIINTINQDLLEGRKIEQHPVNSDSLLWNILDQIIPFCYYTAFRVLIAQPERNITWKSNQQDSQSKLNQSAEIIQDGGEQIKVEEEEEEEEKVEDQEKEKEQLYPLLSQTLTADSIKNSQRALFLMRVNQIKSEQECIKYDTAMRQSAQHFIDSQDLLLLNANPELKQNTYVFEVIMNSELLMKEYIQKCVKDQKKLNNIESISVIVSSINYPIIAKFLDLLFDLSHQEEIKKSKQTQTKFRAALTCLLNKTLKQYLKLKELAYNENLKKFIFSKSSLQYYYIIKPLQKYIAITDDDVESISKNLQQKWLDIEFKQENQSLLYKEYISYAEELLIPKALTEISEYLILKYEGLNKPALIDL